MGLAKDFWGLYHSSNSPSGQTCFLPLHSIDTDSKTPEWCPALHGSLYLNNLNENLAQGLLLTGLAHQDFTLGPPMRENNYCHFSVSTNYRNFKAWRMGKTVKYQSMLMFYHKGQLSFESLLFISCVLQAWYLTHWNVSAFAKWGIPTQVTRPRYQQAYRVISRLINSICHLPY